MTKRRAKTAADFLAELQSDPEYRERQAAIEESRAVRRAVVNSAAEPLLEAMRSAGFPLASLDELQSQYSPISEPVAQLLLEQLPCISDEAVQEQIVRALTSSAAPIPAAPLMLLFQTAKSEALRYAIANTMALADVKGADTWLTEAVHDARVGAARQPLALAVARRLSRAQANVILISLLDDMPGHAALALAETGQLNELLALERRYNTVTGWEKKEIGRAMSVIRRRLSQE